MKTNLTIVVTNPIELFGVENKHIDSIISYFPDLSIKLRGSEINIEGEEDEIECFEKAVKRLIDIIAQKSFINRYDIEQVCGECKYKSSVPSFSCNEPILFSTEGHPIKPLTAGQQKMVESYMDNDMILALGPAGSGKTYIAIALAVRALKNKEIKRIILTRPAVEAGEKLGFLPGDLKEKLDPYLQPLYDALFDMIPSKKLQFFLSDGTIQIVPLAYMRGRTLNRACVILDEAQNTNFAQLKMFLTRLGCGSKFIINGDPTQIDLPNKNESGLLKVVEKLKQISGIETINLSSQDIVRHPLVSQIVKAFEE